MKEKLVVSFSGGRTSAFMLWWIVNNMKDKEIHVIFANTGLEHENTLKFVHQVGEWLDIKINWVEAVINPEKGKGTRHRVVTYETATRGGKLFDDLCAKYGIPNAGNGMHCTRELKLSAMNSFRKEHDLTDCQTAIGIRSDEIDRMSDKMVEQRLTYPLVKYAPYATKEFIRHWWSDKPFDLEVEEHYGNCVTCWKKSFKKLCTVYRDDPSHFDTFKELEHKYGKVNAHLDPTGKGNKFFRGYRGVEDIEEMSKMMPEFKDVIPSLQVDMFWEETNGCSDSCEVY